MDKSLREDFARFAASADYYLGWLAACNGGPASGITEVRRTVRHTVKFFGEDGLPVAFVNEGQDVAVSNEETEALQRELGESLKSRLADLSARFAAAVPSVRIEVGTGVPSGGVPLGGIS